MAVCVAAMAVCVGGGKVGLGVIAIAVKVGAMAVCVAAMAVCVGGGKPGVGVIAMTVNIGAIAVKVGAMAVNVGAMAVKVGAMAVCVAAMAVCVGDGKCWRRRHRDRSQCRCDGGLRGSDGGHVGTMAVNVGAMTVCVAAMAVCVAGNGVFVAAGDSTQRAMLLLSIVTAPFRAKTLPVTLAPVFRVMLVSATIFPANTVAVSSVAELPTCQNTLQLGPPLTNINRRVGGGRERASDLENEDRIGVALDIEREFPCQLSRCVKTIDARREGKSTQIQTG